MSIGFEQAQLAVQGGIEKARQMNVLISVAVVDMGRNLLAFARMDNALLGSVELSQGKAFTSATVSIKTSELGRNALPGGPFYSIENSQQRPMILFAGGAPIIHDGRTLGAIGVSGGTLDEDETIAQHICDILSSLNLKS